MKQITITGRLGKDAVLRTTQQGDKVAGFSVAVDDGRGQDKRTVWFEVSLWGRRGEALAQYLTKGTAVAVSGDLSTREHNGRTYLTVRADQVTLLGGGNRDQSSARDRMSDANRAGYDAQAPGGGPDFQDDIPFAAEWRV
ncbi:single-stranded DNA-binding protein [Pontibaca methylaminivorans]|uniref:Single-stranded DNA-binding protein n=1 Tax=Pontibaca methylaminivorans TaxID=515897 RepID=A0A1R3W9Y7_9RHOB|nr:single-stranded DNA-binding protein [Pontibaca methylaminivorans]SIT74615.1 single-strand binding protein [Pontibaca methylaminivorans]